MKAREIVSNVLAGILMAVMNITVAISVAALMFAGTRHNFLAPGIVVLLIGTLVIGLGGTLFSGFGGVVCGPRSGLAPMFAAMVGGLYSTLSTDPSRAILPTILVAIMVTSIVAGLFLFLLGQLKLGNLVRYIPYPVMGGFFAGIGYIFVVGGMTVAMDHVPNLAAINDLHLIHLVVPAILFALALYIGLAKFDHWSTFPVLLAAGITIFYITYFASHETLSAATAAGWLPKIGSSPHVLFPVVSLHELAGVSWGAILMQSGAILVVALLTAIMLLLDTSGIEIITGSDLNPDRELKVMGITNVVNGIVGGYPGTHAASDTAFTYKLGGDRRLMGFVYAGVVIMTILAGTGFIGRVPTFILGGLLMYVGFGFLVDWVWKMRHELPLSDYLIILIILAVIASVNILEGVAFGFAVAIVMFVFNYSRVSVIKSEATGREHASHVVRDLHTREHLNEHGDRILILSLQGFIFFGTSDKLITEIRERIEGKDHVQRDFLVLDFHHVSQLDTSAIRAFSKLDQMSEKFGFHIIITGADEVAVNRLDGIAFWAAEGVKWKHLKFNELNDGVAWCEDQILKELELEGAGIDRDLIGLLEAILEDEEGSRRIAKYFREERWEKGDYLFRQGDAGDSLYLVGSGSVAVVMETRNETRVLRRYQTGAILGEMALYTGEPRSASVLIEEDSVLYRLDAGQLTSMQQADPLSTGKLHAYVVRLLSERLNRANLELQRHL